MPPMLRIITVDPSETVTRLVRSAMALLQRPVRHVDVPAAADALEELGAGCNLLISIYDLDPRMKGFEFAIRVRKESPSTSVIILGDGGDPEEFDEETAKESPYVYLTLPVDAEKIVRLIVAGLESHDAMIAALNPPPAQAAAAVVQDMGPVPSFDLSSARNIIDPLLRDLSAMAIILASRDGQVLLESGAVGYIDREKLVNALLPNIMTNIGVKQLVGGDLSTVQFYDGDEFDVFVLSIGLHHFMCVMYDGQTGSKNFGVITRYGRKAVLSLIDLLGANAFFIQPPVVRREEEPARARTTKVKTKQPTEEAEVIVLEKASLDLAPATPEPQPEAPKLEPIADLNLDDLFGAPVNGGGLDDLFDPEKLEEIAKQNATQGKVMSYEDAQRIGLING
ncbi:MAG: response regulator [bacterium]|nr:response regulator [bacterium]